ncbi:hypothetical protein BJ508DRAFT_130841 [Ascobolus immersus RN42]|uniref:Uncharacterized protein n=1 Tax=Ascobolus immersus RN42 TaxID=1160509 RepID=A0A3N4I615_ASCIM|nr:hypothetical protein BJ508DRAFT_130841 [Ascobolus immersus RN42]
MVTATRRRTLRSSHIPEPVTPSSQISKPPKVSQTAAPAYHPRNIPDISELETPVHKNNLLDSLVQTLKRKEQSLTTPRRSVQPHLFQFGTPIFADPKTPTAGKDEDIDMTTPTKAPKSTARKPLIPESEMPPSPLDSATPSKVNHKPKSGLFDFNFSSGLESAGEKVIAEMKEKARLKKEELKKDMAEKGTSIWDSMAGGAAKKAAAAKEAEADRYDGAHSKEFAKMDSIANHYAAKRVKSVASSTSSIPTLSSTDAPAATAPATPAKSLKRRKSAAKLDEEPADHTPDKQTTQIPPVPPRTAAKRVKFEPENMPKTEAIPRMKTILHKPKPSRKSIAAQPSAIKGFTSGDPLGTPIGQDSPKITGPQTVGGDRFKSLSGKLFGGTKNLFGFRKNADKGAEGLAETSESIPEMTELHHEHIDAREDETHSEPSEQQDDSHMEDQMETSTAPDAEKPKEAEATPNAVSAPEAPARSIRKPSSRIPPPSSASSRIPPPSTAPSSTASSAPLKRSASTRSLLPKKSASSSSVPTIGTKKDEVAKEEIVRDEIAHKDDDFEFRVIKRRSLAPVAAKPEEAEEEVHRQEDQKDGEQEPGQESHAEGNVKEGPQEMVEVNRKENVKRMADYLQAAEARSRSVSPVKQSIPVRSRSVSPVKHSLPARSRTSSPVKHMALPIEQTVGSPMVKNKPGLNPFDVPKLELWAKKGRESAAAYLAKESTPEEDEDEPTAEDTESRVLFAAQSEEPTETTPADQLLKETTNANTEHDAPRMPGGFHDAEDSIEVKQPSKSASQTHPPTNKRVIRPLRPGSIMAGSKPATAKPNITKPHVSSSLLQPTAAALARAAAAKQTSTAPAVINRSAKRKASPSESSNPVSATSKASTFTFTRKAATATKPATTLHKLHDDHKLHDEEEEPSRAAKRTRFTSSSTSANSRPTPKPGTSKPSSTLYAPTAATSSRIASTTSKTKVGGGTVKLDKPAGGVRSTRPAPKTDAKKARWR